eukprot:3895850-Karenia_brevis.AAC.1
MQGYSSNCQLLIIPQPMFQKQKQGACRMQQKSGDKRASAHTGSSPARKVGKGATKSGQGDGEE